MTQRAKIILKNLAVEIRVGVGAEEKKKRQRVLVNLEIQGNIPSYPKGVGECIDYGRFYNFIMQQWSTRPHIDLLESLLHELFVFCFEDPRIVHVKASIVKPDIFPEAEYVGVEMSKSREEFERG